MLSVNLYAAARSVQLSHRLQRAVARPADLALAARPARDRRDPCGWGGLGLPAPASQYASLVAGGLGAAFAFQGLAVAHALSRGLKLRSLMLIALYACCIFRAQYILPVLALIGVVDAFTRLRIRAAVLPTPRPKIQR